MGRMRTLILLAIVGCQNPPAPHPSDEPPALDERESEIRRYVKRLESKNAAVCLDAMEYLPYFGADAVPALIEALGSPSSNARALAAATLARIPDRRAVEPLFPLLDDKGTLELRVLSDDGETAHGAYDNPLPDFVQQQARIALQAITGKRFAKRADGEAWWKENGATFQAKALPPRKSEPAPEHARWLRGVRICLDPGHGGDTHKVGFKRGPTYASEAEINLRVARFLRDLLVEHGAVVTMTRDSDKDVSHEDRAKMASGHDFFLSIHHNWSPRFDSAATTTWYHLTPDHQPAATDLARYVQKQVLAAIGVSEAPRAGGLMSDGLMYEQGFAVLRHLPAEVPGALCEMTYYSNLTLERKLRDIEFNRTEARGLFLGIAEYVYYGIPRATLKASDVPVARFQVFDGLEERGEWAKPYKIFQDHISVKIDGRAFPFEYDEKTGVLSVKHDLPPGRHSAVIALININKNHSLPKPIVFDVK